MPVASQASSIFTRSSELLRERPLAALSRRPFLLHDAPSTIPPHGTGGDLRMMGLKQLISGCFRSLAHAHAFVALRSIITTAR